MARNIGQPPFAKLVQISNSSVQSDWSKLGVEY